MTVRAAVQTRLMGLRDLSASARHDPPYWTRAGAPGQERPRLASWFFPLQSVLLTPATVKTDNNEEAELSHGLGSPARTPGRRGGQEGKEGDMGRPPEGKGQWGRADLEMTRSFLVCILIFFQDVPSVDCPTPAPSRPFQNDSYVTAGRGPTSLVPACG